jgi:hypothetical protein
MLNKIITISSFSLIYSLTVIAQSISFPDDASERGYFDRPWLRYEAEPGKCESDGSFLAPTFDQRKLQSEASNQAAVQLISRGSYVEWTNEQPADGLTIRFSLPDDAEGKGTTGNLTVYINNDSVDNINLNSWWAWQYILRSGSKYPDNTPDVSIKFPRMRFDEYHLRLQNKIRANDIIRLEKADDNTFPYTVDFIELEEVPAPLGFNDIKDVNKVEYSPDKGKLQYFITDNAGKTIFIPVGKYDVDGRITITGNGTKIIGAGIWYTELYFSASSDVKSTYDKRGIESYGSNVTVEGLFLNTVNNKRYYNNDPVYQVGKGFVGSFGTGSVIRNVWAEHFECGGWIEGADNLKILNSRFRNNYADGINLANGCKNSNLEHCSFRNNGDDDMASWSRSSGLCENNSFSYSTSENNWRASSLGFFGGKQNKAFNIVIIDPIEAGFRVTCDFPGMPFSAGGYSEFYNISVYKGGCATGSIGVSGDLWGNEQGALHINSSSQYNLQNIKIYNIDLYDSKNDAIFIGSSTYKIYSLILKDINIKGAGRYGIRFYNTKGDGTYCNILYENVATANTTAVPASFVFKENCYGVAVQNTRPSAMTVDSREGNLIISGQDNSVVSVYDLWGRKCFQSPVSKDPVIAYDLNPGIYIVRSSGNQTAKVLVL